MAAGGTVTMEPPAKMLWRSTLQLQVLAARPHPFCSKPPPRAVLQNPWFRIGQGVGMGTKGLESSISSEVSAWSATFAHLYPDPSPLLGDRILWTNSFLSKCLHFNNQTMDKILYTLQIKGQKTY